VESVDFINVNNGDSKKGIMKLDQDNLPWFSRPVFNVTLSDSFISNHVKKYENNQIIKDFTNNILISNVSISYFDNTIAICSVIGDLDIDEQTIENATVFEEEISKLSELLVKSITNILLPQILSNLSEDRDAKSIMRPSNKYQIFRDLNDHPFPKWNEAINPYFWTHRFIVREKRLENNKKFSEIFRFDDIKSDGVHCRDESIFHHGTSLVSSESALKSIMKISEIAQYYYCLFDIINQNQNSIYRQLTFEKNRRKLIDLTQIYFRMENFLDYTKNEMKDSIISMQSIRKSYLEKLIEALDINALIDVINDRNELLSDRIERRMIIIRRNDRRLFKFFLSLYSAIQIIQLFIDLFDASSTRISTGTIGIINVFKAIDFNITMDTLAVLILLGAIYVSYKSE
jgi:hypothetical protein